MAYALIALVVIVIGFSIITTIKRNNAIQKDGIEADAVVSRVDENEDTDSDGNREVTYVYYVKYQTKDGQTVEAKLGNEPGHLYVGKELRIKYLPEKPKYVIPAR